MADLNCNCSCGGPAPADKRCSCGRAVCYLCWIRHSCACWHGANSAPLSVAPEWMEDDEQTELRVQLLADPLYGYMIRLVEKMYGDFGIKHGPTAFRSRQSSYHHLTKSGHQLVFGYENVRVAARDGYQDYKSIDPYITRGERATGRKAAWYVALHEFAHVTQTELGDLTPHAHHDAKFVGHMRDLMALYPYENTEAYCG